jgi:hypothetical protein
MSLDTTRDAAMQPRTRFRDKEKLKEGQQETRSTRDCGAIEKAVTLVML